MLSLFFPNIDALRLALASGIIPAEVARQRVTAADTPGGYWVSTGSKLAKESVAALAHIGVRSFAAPAELRWRDFPCWAAVLPLKPIGDDSSTEPVLFELPTVGLAHFLQELMRCGTPWESFRITDDESHVRLAKAPLYWIDRSATEADSTIRSYRSAGPNFWVQSGWQHPLPPEERTDTFLVSVADGWRVLESGTWQNAPDETPLRPITHVRCQRDPLLAMPVPMLLQPIKGVPEAESFWIHTGSFASLGPLIESVDSKTLNHLEAAVLDSPDGVQRVALSGKGWVVSGRGFYRHPKVGRLLIPADQQLAPDLRVAALVNAFRLESTELIWLEPTDGTFEVNRVPLAAFRPLSHWIRYAVPEQRAFRSSTATDTPFVLSGFVVVTEAAPLSEPLPGVRVHTAHSGQKNSRRDSVRSRFAEWAGKLFAKASEAGDDPEPDESDDTPAARDPSRRASRTLQERLARRAELEERLFRQDDFIDPARMYGDWAELAQLYTAGGNATDATLCWLHALWGTQHPPETWLQQWDKLEENSRISTPPSMRFSRRAVLGLIRLASTPGNHPPAEFDLKTAVAQLESIEDKLPCRMVWLALAALSKLNGGDVLLLARGRDRLFARLQSDTALAALDTPSFLRFRGLVGGDRFPLARDWLLRCRDPIHRWLKQQSPSAQLAWAGIGADIACTSAYADWMLAWGSAKLGDQARTNELSEAASRALASATGNSAEQPVHRTLEELYRSEIRVAFGAGSQQADLPGRPADQLADYAVAKLLAHSQILGRSQSRSEYGGQPLLALLGDDDLGTALSRRLENKVVADDAAIRAMLARADRDRTAATLPRIILTLLEVVENHATVAEVLAFAPCTLELLPEALRLRGVQDTEGSSYLVRLAGRGVELVCDLSVRHGLPELLRVLVGSLSQAVDNADRPTREALRLSGSKLFRALSRCGLTAELRQLLGRWSLIGGESTESELNAAIGWYTLGDTERGNRILNEARDRLFVRGIPSERDRTRTALAYARALAHAPPRLALGRLEEMFQRLGPISTGGATARYFALKPLELIDTAITAIVNEDFSLGPEVRSWLDADELRIRTRITRDLDAAMKGTNATTSTTFESGLFEMLIGS